MAYDPALSYSDRQKLINASLASDPLVAVFQVTTHDGKTTIEEDMTNKVDAMHAAGVRNFEGLIRGDSTMPLHTHSPLGLEMGATLDQTYFGQVSATISKLAQKYKDSTFGVGTISNEQMMKDVLANPDISFAMTAHWPTLEDGSITRTAINGKLPILFTASEMKNVVVERKGSGELLNVDQPGKDTLFPPAVAELRAAGVDIFKASDFTKIALKRAETIIRPGTGGVAWKDLAQKKDAEGALTKVSLGLIAIAEAIRESYNGQVPANEKFTVATTGGVDLDTLPYLATGAHNPEVRGKIVEMLGRTDALVLLNILERTTLGAGGTFMTKDYDKLFAAGKTEEAKASLFTMAQKAVSDITAAKAALAEQSQARSA